MPTVTVTRADVPREEAMEAVRQELGSEWKVKPGGGDGVFSVEKGTLTGAKVHIKANGGTTQFHVHGTGIIIGRIINELTVARKVAAAISKSSLSTPASSAAPPTPAAPVTPAAPATPADSDGDSDSASPS
jgi:hypothetical protein